MPITRTLTPCKIGRVKFATSTAPRPPLADLASNPTPPGGCQDSATKPLRLTVLFHPPEGKRLTPLTAILASHFESS